MILSNGKRTLIIRGIQSVLGTRCFCDQGKARPRRVVVTGLGLVTPLGTGVKHVWQKLINGQCGLTSIVDKEYDGIPSRVAGLVPKGDGPGEFDQTHWYQVIDKRSTSDEAFYAVAASTEAMKDSGWEPKTEKEKERTGVCIGSGIGGIKDIPLTSAILKGKGYRKVSPFFVPRILVNMPAGIVSMHFGLEGPNHAVATACAASAHAIGDAFRMVAYGDADAMLAGGAEACITPLSMAGFCKARALTTKFNDNPQQASRPFDGERSGFVMGEGSGMIVLEEYTHASRRGAPIYAEILGYGLSGDAYHITAPSQDGKGAYIAMRNAMKDAGVLPQDIHYINAHATSTPLGDAVENRAIVRLISPDTKRQKLKISSTKGAVGHLLGAAGAVETIFTIMALLKGVVPPTLNLHNFDPNENFESFNYVSLKSQELVREKSERLVALTNSFGFGGTNACLCIGEWSD